MRKNNLFDLQKKLQTPIKTVAHPKAYNLKVEK